VFSPAIPWPEAHEPLLVSVPRAAQLLGIGLTLAWELVHAGAIPSLRLGRRALVSRAVLEELARAGTSFVEQTGNHVPPSPLQSGDQSLHEREGETR
jgi:excisionase family DNA binding protein